MLSNDEIREVFPSMLDIHTLIFRIPYGLRVGEKTFTSLNIFASGFISLGPVGWYARYMYRPLGEGFSSSYRLPMIAPFWDYFHPSLNYEGRVYYQVNSIFIVYHNLTIALDLNIKSVFNTNI